VKTRAGGTRSFPAPLDLHHSTMTSHRHSTRPDDTPSSPLPQWLARHVGVGFDQDDVAALVDSIDCSQTSPFPHLPAELLLQILEHVPVDYLLDWRIVCRSFRDAIDGRILYHHLRRTQLIGYVGTQETYPLSRLEDAQYERIHLLRANFRGMAGPRSTRGALWANTHAVFDMDTDWFDALAEIGGTAGRHGDAIEDADPRWLDLLDRLELPLADEPYGTLRWCFKLDHAVFDLDIPLFGRTLFDVHVSFRRRTIRVAWKDMLMRLLKTERALRRIMENTLGCKYTFTHAGDCLREVRRQQMRAACTRDNKADRRALWALRDLCPLFGKHQHGRMGLPQILEDLAIDVLLLLRREAALTSRQLAYLRQLHREFQTMQNEIKGLNDGLCDFTAHLSLPGSDFTAILSRSDSNIPPNPVAWPDDLRASVEERVGKWKSQRKVMAQISALLSASNEALAVPEDSFDDLGSDI
jgi:hypothetical protein